MKRRTPTEQEKVVMREVHVPPAEPHADIDALLVQADRTLETHQGEMMTIGQNYMVFTPAITLVGCLGAMTAWEIRLDNASWVADTGRYHQAFEQGLSSTINSEVEPCGGPAIVLRGAIMYAVPYMHALPKSAI